MDAGSSALSCQSRDHIFEVLSVVASGQDQICEFIKHKDDECEVDSTCLHAILERPVERAQDLGDSYK